jgi:hypothetical protein
MRFTVNGQLTKAEGSSASCHIDANARFDEDANLKLEFFNAQCRHGPPRLWARPGRTRGTRSRWSARMRRAARARALLGWAHWYPTGQAARLGCVGPVSVARDTGRVSSGTTALMKRPVWVPFG